MEDLLPELVAISHAIHAAPELRFEEHAASALLQRSLAYHQFSVSPATAGMATAFLAERRFGEGGPTVAIFCEFDALAGIGHGCGHNIIAAAGTGAAVAAGDHLAGRPQVAGRILVVGSPGEEGGGGKLRLLEAGVLDDVDAAIMVHPAGFDAVRRTNPGRASFEVRFRGRAAHAAAAPEEGRNALDGATLLLVALGLLRQQIRPDARIHAIVRDGGQSVNVIPEEAAVSVFLRSPDGAYLRGRLELALRDCAAGSALSTGTTADVVEPSPPYLPVEPNPVLLELARRAWEAVGRDPSGGGAEGGSSGSTDMGNVSHAMPAVHPYLCVVPGAVLHTREFTTMACGPDGDRAVADGATVLGVMACALLEHPELAEAARLAHGSR